MFLVRIMKANASKIFRTAFSINKHPVLCIYTSRHRHISTYIN